MILGPSVDLLVGELVGGRDDELLAGVDGFVGGVKGDDGHVCCCRIGEYVS